MKYLLILLLLPFGVIAQRVVEVTKISTGKTVLIKEGTRAKVRTIDGNRYYGKITFLDDQTLVLRKETLQLENIVFIQKRSASKAVGTALMIVASTILVSSASVVALSSPPSGLAFAVTGGALLTTGIVLPSLAAKHQRKRWRYKILL